MLRTEQEVEWGERVYGWLVDEILTEEHTDLMAEALAGHVPLGKEALDAVLPEALVVPFREIFQRLGWIRDSDRWAQKGNPFRWSPD